MHFDPRSNLRRRISSYHLSVKVYKLSTIYESLGFDVHILLIFVVRRLLSSPLYALKNILILSGRRRKHSLHSFTFERIRVSRLEGIFFKRNSTLFKFIEHPYNFLLNYIGVRLFNRQKFQANQSRILIKNFSR